MLDDVALESLGQRPGVEWGAVKPEVLPAWIADQDLPVVAPARYALLRNVDNLAARLGPPERMADFAAAGVTTLTTSGATPRRTTGHVTDRGRGTRSVRSRGMNV
ncbi:hypothetical protein [Embleya sp. NBC_00896]|uniref:hypothetical protein n=1 Tax=Embleya sp. NBC_00896 TaxID=2975961 RepID=UPI0038700399|nr:hypothetical protein OG928_00070 [Embleya sp. NBC_00896]